MDESNHFLESKMPSDEESDAKCESETDQSETRDGVEANPVAEAIRQIYRETWNDFYKWEQDVCRRDIAALKRHVSSEDTGTSATASGGNVPIDLAQYSLPREALSDAEEELVVFYGSECTEIFSSCKVVEAPASFGAFPVYESCTPATSNLIPHHRGAHSEELLQFFPFADNEGTNFQEFADLHEDFLWMVDQDTRDPDILEIQYETVRRSMEQMRGLTVQEIDRMDSTGLPRLRENDRLGLLPVYSRRDHLHWAKSIIGDETNSGDRLSQSYPVVYQSKKTDQIGRVDDAVSVFCANLNCLISGCYIHSAWRPAPVIAKLTSMQLLKGGSRTCGQACFKINAVDDPDDVIWDSEAVGTLQAILNACPDLSPCKAALACRKPCYEVFALRQQLILDSEIETDCDTASQGVEPRIPVANVALIRDPCSHSGPCDLNCPCTQDSVYCQRLCHCGPSCSRQWKGCSCKRSAYGKKACKRGASSCVCIRANRECDPELCKGCFSARLTTCSVDAIAAERRCNNSSIQHGRRQQIRVSDSQYGFGAFAGENIKKDSFIAEYVGEILSNKGEETVEFLNTDRKRNYTFTLRSGDINDENSKVLDAVSISNETRFPNHPHAGKKANCEANTIYVNGVKRIGLFATEHIKAKREIFLDYGDNFFKD